MLEEKVAIVTGAARGMGAAEARLFAAEGARVVLTDIDMAGAAIAEVIGEPAMFVQHDVADAAGWNAWSIRLSSDTVAWTYRSTMRV